MNCANFAPQDGSIIMGWNIDLDRHDTIANMLTRMDSVSGGSFTATAPGAFGMFMKIGASGLIGQTPNDPTNKADLDVVLNQLKGTNAIFVTSLDPTEGYDNVNQTALLQFANKLAEFNKYGIPVLLRPAHEMNGPWYAYGQQPTKFKTYYINVVTTVRTVAPYVRFIFAPNLGTGYPWTSIPPKTPLTAADIAAADTNGNGVIDAGDDPYTPYYPGDQYVDWWGASMYYKGAYPYTVNSATPAGFIASQLNEVLGGNVSSYEFARRRNLPIIFPEMAGSYCAQHNGSTNLATKQQFWRDAFGPETRILFPLLKMDEDGAQRDFSISNLNSTLPTGQSSINLVAPSFKQDIATYKSLIYASNLTLSGSGNCGCFRYNAAGAALSLSAVTTVPIATVTNLRESGNIQTVLAPVAVITVTSSASRINSLFVSILVASLSMLVIVE
ncbi:hypothetical protein HK096_003057 [Nowakowskiella sp. JEL0078]|nr:hypothetical protein HK096_003057 [Nowakowskiella sp. JEL0078]